MTLGGIVDVVVALEVESGKLQEDNGENTGKIIREYK